MKKTILFFLLIFSIVETFAQKGYWQQQVDHNLSVSLNDTTSSLTCNDLIHYVNNSPDTLHFIKFHVWMNAYKNDRTAFSEQLLQDGRTDFYFGKEQDRGYIDQLNFSAKDAPADFYYDSANIDIITVVLPRPLPPHQSLDIRSAFYVKLPLNISRGGHTGQSYQLTQWFPKPAVYDRLGWHAMAYLDRGEFFSEFGNYKVNITVPEKYIVASTGRLTVVDSSANTRSYVAEKNNIHDFAWFANRDFIHESDTMQLQNKIINVHAYHLKDETGIWNNSISYIKNAIRSKSAWVGAYPYSEVSVVENTSAVGGGMEYPGITLVNAGGSAASLEKVINHEVGHNWFYGILANDERTYPWMDEGMNTYYDHRYESLYMSDAGSADKKSGDSFLAKRLPDNLDAVLLHVTENNKTTQPINTPSAQFSSLNYQLVAYEKTALWMKMLEMKLGTSVFDTVMKTYYDRWKFKHPYPENFKAVAQEVSGMDLSAEFEKMNSIKPVTINNKQSVKPALFFNLKETDRYRYISFGPAAGMNYYDRLMLGAVIHNYSLPSDKFQFLVVPLYATGSKKMTGLARLSYDVFPGNHGAKFTASVAAATFSRDSYTDLLNKKHALSFSKIVPGLRYIFANRSSLSHMHKSIQLKTYLIDEEEVAFRTDVNNVQMISFPHEKRYVNQFTAGLENSRVLYPYSIAFKATQGDAFVRTDVTANYFFNFPKGGGLNVRMFAGKFIYTADHTFLQEFKTERYHLTMTGPKGDEDFTYSNYFAGRSEFEGFASQQIMQRDGFFKVRTDLLSDKIGKTDDWLSSINLTADVPKPINPLSFLPVNIPLKIFADFGTYAEAWNDKNIGGKILYDAGLQLSLFKNVINIYVPLVYSKVYSDYLKSTITEKRFLKTISFSFDIQNLQSGKLFPQLPL